MNRGPGAGRGDGASEASGVGLSAAAEDLQSAAMRILSLGLVALLFALSGCVVRMQTRPAPLVVDSAPPPPRPPPPPVRPAVLTYDGAVARGDAYCRSRGLPCYLKDAHLTGNAVWKLKYDLRGDDGKGHLHLDLDAYSGRVLRDDLKFHEHGHKHHDEDDD